MAKVVVLGGAGAVGRVAVKTLAGVDTFSEIVAADLDLAKTRRTVAAVGSPKVKARKIDVLDAKSLTSLVRGCDVVLNCSGPFYRLALPVLRAVLAARVDYVDVCDDVDVTLEMLALDAAAKQAGVHALIGMGSSPGATNVLAKLAAELLLEEVDSIDIFHAHGGEPEEGEGVIAHRFHCMSIDIPMYLDGQLRHVRFFDADGVALRQTFTFPLLGEALLYPYPHPEQVTLPRHIRCRRVTNKGTVLPAAYYELTVELCRLGLAAREPLVVRGRKVVPYDFAVAFLLRERERILAQGKFGPQRGCVTVVAKGRQGGRNREYRFSLASRSQALGEGTGIPAALGALLMAEGRVAGPGVLPPEACVRPTDFLDLVPKVMKLDRKKEGGEGFGGVIVESVDEQGAVTRVNL